MSYYLWLIFAVIAFVIEMIMPTFFAMFAGIGFLVAAGMAYIFPESLFLQLVIASVFMIIGAIIFKKNRIADDSDKAVGTHDEFIGIEGVVIKSVSAHQEGEVELYEPIVGSRQWSALSSDGEIATGEQIRVVKLNGNTVIVSKID